MKSVFKIIILSLCFSACVGDLDFEQAEDLTLEPTVAISLLNFQLNEDDLAAIGSTGETSISDEVILPSLNNTLIQEDLDRLVLQFEVTNTLNAEFTIDFVFLDENDVRTYTVTPIIVPANTTEVFTFEEEIVILNNPLFLRSEKINISIRKDDSTIDVTQEGLLDFMSAGVFYFSIN